MSLEQYLIIYAVVIVASAVVLMNAYQNVTTFMKRRSVSFPFGHVCAACFSSFACVLT
jgi:hypothetical protein